MKSLSFKKFRTIVCIVAVLVWLTHALLLLECRPALLQAGFLTEAYDQLAKNILDGVSVAASPYIDFEGMGPDQAFMYFGPLPAIIRIIPLWLWPETFLSLGYLSSITAQGLFFYFISRSLLLIGVNGRSSISVKHLYLSMLVLLGVGFGSPLTTILAKSIYHEAIFWGLAMSAGVIYYAISIIEQKVTHRSLFFLGLFSGAALLARLTYGLSSYAVCGAVLASLIFERLRTPAKQRSAGASNIFTQILVLTLPLAVAGSVQLFYNYARFGDLFQFIDLEGWKLARTTPEGYEVLVTKGSFYLSRIPSSLWVYFSPLFYHPIETFPFLTAAYHADTALYFMTAQTFPLTLGSSWLLLTGAFGLSSLYKRGISLLLVFTLAFSIQAILILCYLAIMQRYTPEFMPLLLFLTFLWLSDSRKGASAVGAKKLLILSSCVVLSVVLTLGVFWFPSCKEFCSQRPDTECGSLLGRISC